MERQLQVQHEVVVMEEWEGMGQRIHAELRDARKSEYVKKGTR